VPAWEHRFSSGPACVMCGSTSRTVVANLTRDDLGVCEACSVLLYRAWHDMPEDLLPPELDGEQREADRSKVLLMRLRKGRPESLDSYEVAFCPTEEGLDLPTVKVADKQDEVDAVVTSLASYGVVTWPPFVDTLYTALSPRGKLVRLVFVSAYTHWQKDEEGGVSTAGPKSGERELRWLDWPPWKRAAGMASLLVGLRDVMPVRVWRHFKGEETSRKDSLVTVLRRAASEYIYMQQDLRAGEVGVDVTGAELLRRNMSADEKEVDRLVRVHEEVAVEEKRQKEEEKPGTPPEVAASPELPGLVGSAGDDAGDGEDGGDAGGGSLEEMFDEEPEPTGG
jgi:hypothetical protein